MDAPALDSVQYHNAPRLDHVADRVLSGTNRELLQAIGNLRNELNGRLELMESRFQTRLDLMELKQAGELRLLRWMVGTLAFVLIALLAFTVPLGPIR